jgi:DNA-binding NarL/FixJ family response regulator
VTRVLLVDDQPLARAGMRRILELGDGFDVVGECADGDEVVEAVARCRPDVVVMDVRMRRVDGAEATRRLAAVVDRPPVLVLTTFDDHDTVVAALTAGATGFVLKDAPGEDLLRATALVADGQAWLDPRIAPEVLDVYRRRAGDDREVRAALGDLTPRELDVLVLVGRGATNAEIAGELIIGEATVKSHLGRVLAKLGLRDRAAAIVLAHRQGLA